MHQPIPVKCDDQSAIYIGRNQGYSRTKHLDMKHHFMKDVLAKQIVNLDYVNTKDQPADGFTKHLNLQKHNEFRKLIGIMA